MKWGLEWVENYPFEMGQNRWVIIRSKIDEKMSGRAEKNVRVFKSPSFFILFFYLFFRRFFEISEKSKKNRPKNPCHFPLPGLAVNPTHTIPHETLWFVIA